jgi:hypothetical protein
MRVTVRLLTLLPAALMGVAGGVARAEIVADATPAATGSTGLFRMSTVDGVGAPAIRLAAFAQFARSTNFLVLDDVDTRFVPRLAAAADIGRYAQLFASLSLSYNRDQQPVPDAPDIVESAFVPDLFLGAKAVAWRNDIFAIGGELGARVPLSGPGLPGGISGWLDVLASARLLSAGRSAVRAHVSAGYYLDNEQKLLDIDNPSGSDIEVFMFEHAAGTDRFRYALGLEGALQGQRSPRFSPFVEYHREIAHGSPNDRLLTEALLKNFQQWITFGLKVGIGQRLTLEAGADVAIESPGLAYGPPLPPFDLWAGVSVPFQTSGSGAR